MSLFTEPVDRYFVAKVAAGLLFFYSAGNVLRAAIVAMGVGSMHLRGMLAGQPPAVVAWVYGIAAIAWLVVFRFIESRRLRHRKKGAA